MKKEQAVKDMSGKPILIEKPKSSKGPLLIRNRLDGKVTQFNMLSKLTRAFGLTYTQVQYYLLSKIHKPIKGIYDIKYKKDATPWPSISSDILYNEGPIFGYNLLTNEITEYSRPITKNKLPDNIPVSFIYKQSNYLVKSVRENHIFDVGDDFSKIEYYYPTTSKSRKIIAVGDNGCIEHFPSLNAAAVGLGVPYSRVYLALHYEGDKPIVDEYGDLWIIDEDK